MLGMSLGYMAQRTHLSQDAQRGVPIYSLGPFPRREKAFWCCQLLLAYIGDYCWDNGN